MTDFVRGGPGVRAQGESIALLHPTMPRYPEQTMSPNRRCLGGQCSGLAASATSTTTSALGGIANLRCSLHGSFGKQVFAGASAERHMDLIDFPAH
jgi:hypothetical protein